MACAQGVLWLVLVCCPRAVAVAEDAASPPALQAFLEAVHTGGDYSHELRAAVAAMAARMHQDEQPAADIIHAALRELNLEFHRAMIELSDEDATAAIARLTPLAASREPYLAAESTYFLARAHMMNEQCEEALVVLQRLVARHAAHCSYGAEALFFIGVCQERLLQRREALATFTQFLDEHPDAAERMRITAAQRIAQLSALDEGALADVHQRMEYVRRRLAIGHSGRRTQEEQDNIIAMLDRLLEEHPPHGPTPQDPPPRDPRSPDGKPGPDEPGVPRPGAPRPGPGHAPSGNNRSGDGADAGDPDHPPATARRTSSTRGDWSRARDNDREAKAFEALKRRFPARYTELVKQYYRSLAEDAE